MAVEVPRWTASLLEPFGQAIAVLVLIAAGATAAFVLTWRGAARTVYVPLQMPWVISGGLGGLALLGVAVGAWSIHLSRRHDAEAQLDRDEFTRDLTELCENIRANRGLH